jgi:archaellum biogenesis protein FlaJ (TadC family)
VLFYMDIIIGLSLKTDKHSERWCGSSHLRKVKQEELHNLDSLRNFIRTLGETCSTSGHTKSCIENINLNNLLGNLTLETYINRGY